MAVKVYSQDEVSVNIAGNPIDGGRGDDEFISITQNEDDFTAKSGVDGEVTRSRNKNRITRIVLTLQATSASNDILSAIHNLDLKTDGGSGIFPIQVRDRAGTQVFIAPEAWIVKAPDLKFAKESGQTPWLIDCAEPERFDGGH